MIITALRRASKLCAVLLYLNFGSAELYSTTIVVLWNPTKVFIASDSKVVHDLTDETTTHFENDRISSSTEKATVEEKACKVHVNSTGCCVVAAQGWFASSSGHEIARLEKRWDLWRALDAATDQASTAESASEAARRQLTSALIPFKEDYAGPRCDDCIYFSFVIAGVQDDGKSVVTWTCFRAEKTEGKLPRTVTEKHIGEFGWRCFGRCSAVKTYLLKNPNYPPQSPGFAENAKTLVRMQIQATPKSVGEPVSLTVLSKAKGIEWRERGTCNGSASSTISR